MIHNSDNSVMEEPSDILSDTAYHPDISDDDVFFAKERYKLHQSSPDEGVDEDILKKYFFKNYGFQY